MRAIRAFALATVLTVSTATATLAGDTGGYARPIHPTEDAIQGDTGGYSVPTVPQKSTEDHYGEFWA